MKIALIGASGSAGLRILNELVRRDHSVTAIVRNPDRVPQHESVVALKGNIHDNAALTAQLVGHDAVVSSVHFTVTDPHALVEAVKQSGVSRYLVVGGAGSLEVRHGVALFTTPEFPAAYKEEAVRGAEFLEVLRSEQDLDWTYLSPSAMFFSGERTGIFRLGKDQLLSDENGSRISFEDYAVALVDEIEARSFTHTIYCRILTESGEPIYRLRVPSTNSANRSRPPLWEPTHRPNPTRKPPDVFQPEAPSRVRCKLSGCSESYARVPGHTKSN